jgi:putative PIN family toxin of toxin-antitoxin system
MRVVLDTNVLISACLKPDGLEAKVVEMVLTGSALLCVTEEIWAEYGDVFSRPKFAVLQVRSGTLLSDLDRLAVRITAPQRVTAALDEDDNRFLECAAAAGAEYLVTGNLRHYPAEWAATKIVNARQFRCIIRV